MVGRALVVTLALFALGCADDEPVGPFGAAGAGGAGGGAPLSWPNLECDPLVPSYCGYPFPSNVFSVEDASTPTGRRVNLLPGSLPLSASGGESLPDPINRADGFSPSSALLAHFPGATSEGLAGPDRIADSLAADSLTIVLDAESGARVPHFAELDVSRNDPEQRSLSIRPAVRLADDHRYIVAIRGLTGESGPLEPSEAFRALRDGSELESEPSVAARRALYEDIFQRLEAAGVPRDDLLLAWDFSTRSRQDITGWLLHMRDEALDLVGPDGPSYEIDEVVTDPDPDIAFQIKARMQVPLYLDQPAAGANLVFGADGMPEPNADTPTYDVPVDIWIPKSAATEPAKLLLYGHGLLGSRSQIGASHFRRFMNEYGYAFFGVDLVGMSEDGDSGQIVSVISAGEMHRLSTMFDRLHQGALNHVLAMRMVSRRFAKDPEYGKYLDPSARYYHGISQGGIFGGVYMAISPDVERGVLGVMGQPYTLLLNRSVDFNPFFVLLGFSYPDARDQQFLLALIQMLWDRVEPGGHTAYLSEGDAGSGPHSVLMRAAVGDHQVTTLGAHVMARTIGATHLDTGVREIFGLEQQAGPFTGSAYVEYDFGLPPEPLCNVPMEHCEDPHGLVRSLEAAEKQMDLFLRTGEARNFCPDGSCKFPELGGCEPGKTYPDLCAP